MHKLTNNRMAWGLWAVLAGVALSGAGWLGGRARPNPQKLLYGMASVCCLSCAVVTADTKPTAYALQAHEHRIGAYDSFFTLRLYNTATGRAVWNRTVRGYGTAGVFK